MRTHGLGRRWLVIGRLLVLGLAPVAGSACLVVFSTSPTELEDATLVFVVRDDGGAFVAQVHMTVTAVSGDWSADGLTASDGSYRCRLMSGVRRVRVSVDPPQEFGRVPGWPRELDVQSVDQPIEVQILRTR